MRRLMTFRTRLNELGIFAFAFIFGTGALAEEVTGVELSADTFRPALDASGVLDVESGALSPHLGADVGLFTGYLLNPLVLRQSTDKGLQNVGALVAHRWNAHVVGSLGLFDWVQLGIDLPLVLLQGGEGLDAAQVGNIANQQLAVAGLGDLRLRPKIRILRRQDFGVDLAFMPTVVVPSHFPMGGYLGDAGFGIAPELAISTELGGLVLASNVAALMRDDTTTNQLGISHELVFRGAIAYLFESINLRTDLSVRTSTSLLRPYSQAGQSPLEAIAGIRWEALQGLYLQSGVGIGLITGPGTPDARAFVGLRYAPRVRDSDGDGITDNEDACTDAPEDIDNFQDTDGCPDLDNDGDGVQDPDDQCVNAAEDMDAFEDEDGCPDPDNDKDGIMDPDDECPLVAGVTAYKGCSAPDADGDGVPDAKDACPKQAGQSAAKGCPDQDSDGIFDAKDFCPKRAETQNGVADSDGCPDGPQSKWVLTKTEIQLLAPIDFEYKSEELLGPAIDTLNQVAELLVQHPEIEKVQVEVHTDELRKADASQELAEARASAVMIHLATAGVAIERLDSVSTGAKRPRSRRGKRIRQEADRLLKIRIVKWGKAAKK